MGSFHPEHKVLLVLLAAVAYYARGCEASFKVLGCNFTDSKYTLHTKEAVYGHELPGLKINPSSQIQNLRYENLIRKLCSISADVTGKNIINDWDPFIKFIQAYKSQKGQKSLESFYDDYHVEFEPRQDSAGFVIEIYNQLKGIYAEAANNMYLVTVSKVVQNVIGPHTRNSHHHHHVAGAIRIISDDMPTTYFIMDPSIGLTEIVILKEDGEDIVPVGFYKDFIFKWLPDSKLALAYVKAWDADVSSMQHVYTYNLAQPFCSFLDNTLKERLLSTEHKISSRFESGVPKAYFSFDLLPLNVPRTQDHTSNLRDTNPFHRFKLASTRTTDLTAQWVEMYIPMLPANRKQDGYTALTKKETSPIYVDEKIIRHCNKFKPIEIEPEDIVAKMNFLRTEVFNDEAFVWEIFNLQKKMDILPEQEDTKNEDSKNEDSQKSFLDKIKDWIPDLL